MTTELCDLTGSELATKIAGGEVSATEVVESSLRRIEAVDDNIGAILTRTPEVALERAAELDTHRGTGAPQHPVAGIPLALKDVLATMGIRTTCGSLILEHAAKVSEVAAEDVPPTAYAIPRANVYREDRPEPSLPQPEALANAPEQEDGRFKVVRIVEGG